MQLVNPIKTLKHYRLADLQHDLPAGLSVFLVALPLCLGIALASGAPLFSGLVAGILGGIVVGTLSGSELSVSGPAAGLAVIVADSIVKLGTFEAFLVAVMLAGAIQVALGWFKAGRFSSLFPDSVIKGMLVGIGIVIILKQIPHALGRDNDYEGEFEFSQLADGENTISEIYRAFVTASPGAVLISILSIIVLIFWERVAGRGYKFFKNLPAALTVVFIGVIFNQLYLVYFPDWYLGDNNEHMVRVPIMKAGQSITSIFDFPDFSSLANPAVYGVAATIALVASLETLLNLEASDRLDPLRRNSSTNQELIAQGMGNIFSGLLGGLPITSVVVRTSANVFGGGKTRVSAITHGVLLLCAVALAGAMLNHIPLACLAALLIMVGYKLAKPALFISIYREGLNQFVPFIVTVIGIVFTDLLIGISVGTVIGLLYVLYSNSRATFRVIRDGDKVLIKFQKDIYFLSKPQLKETLQSLKRGDRVYVDGRHANFIDHDIVNMLTDFSVTANMQGIHYELNEIFLNKQYVKEHASLREAITGE
ncbi:SulP family inorganic anion transporter [Fibrella forsythiae]|uniref:SulP family inorganic anion transporter n=1 Tax=Fibrella forsythiae TaxID=2817061 RepID=A0ABS3JMT1_9BACT|nr:SulP family inorganic anion transporter [Fibrella forsythiae]MBO0951304.1 SulP family inorganic anion transporter [Fibrella forsythiae]